MEEELNTLCYCQSCELERKDIDYQLKQMPPSVTGTSIANYLNLRYEQMRDKCLNKKRISAKIAEDNDKFGCENIYTIVGALTFLGAALGVIALLAMVVWLAAWLPMS